MVPLLEKHTTIMGCIVLLENESTAFNQHSVKHMEFVTMIIKNKKRVTFCLSHSLTASA